MRLSPRPWAIIALLCLMATGRAATAEHLLEATPVHPVSSLQMGSDPAELRFLDRSLDGVRVLSLGEVLHGYKESLELRNRLFQFLVETHGFTAIAAETGFVEGTAVDDYIIGKGELTEQLVRNVFSFNSSAGWQENRRLLEWMRAYNARSTTKRKLRFYGIEMLGHVNYVRDADRVHLRKAADFALDYLQRVDPVLAASWRARFEPLLAALVASRYEALPSTDRDALTLATADLVSLFERRHVEWLASSSSEAYHRAHRSAVNARNLDADLRATGWWTPTPRRNGDIAQRDAAMAQSVLWALDRQGADGKLMVFSANGHASRDAGRGEPVCLEATSCSHAMGSHLHQQLGRQMLIVAMIDRRTAVPDRRLDELWASTRPAMFAVDFSALTTSGPAQQWWQSLTWYEADLRTRLPLIQNFDVAFFFDGLSKATPLH
ncbi:erythromycin esterase family protein [Steroidobacter sp.]|uniref:erythromycin esterase family protein n=1 Tax=Steroidobacter sp. TaxID=1978227 RepID=UPI001A5FED14|nr:erythromycin esterase family protein [Steroidobacter sp.]MBL8270991.1 erythromycin esterase family protein [Steroidobacter sp.]